MSCPQLYTPALSIENIKSTMVCQTALHLPSSADFIFRLERELHKLDNNIDDIISVLDEKPVLVSRILSYVNSDEFKDKIKKYPNYRIENIEQVITAYGIKHLHKLAISYSFENVPTNLKLLKHTIHTALTCAQCCSEVTSFIDDIKRDAAYMYALVKDFGHITFSYKYGEHYKNITKVNHIDPFKAFKMVEELLHINITFVHVAIATCFGIGMKRDNSTDWIDERNILLAAQEQFNVNFSCIQQDMVRKLIAIGYIGSTLTCRIYGKIPSPSLSQYFEISKNLLDLSDEQLHKIEQNVKKHLQEGEYKQDI